MIYSTNYIETINTLKEQLESLLPMEKKHELRLKMKLRLEFNFNSNHLEGNTLSYGQTQLLLFYDKSSGDVPVSDIEEMKAHDLALTQIEEMAQEQERPLTQQFICELNKIILVKPFWKDAISYDGSITRKKIEIGKYKSSPNSVRLKNGKIHEYASPEETPAKMDDLLSWYREHLDKLHPVQLAAEFHYKFVCIHPFDDGNGRVARLIMNYILFKNNYPPIIIKSEDKENYLTALQKADTGNLLAFIEYVEKQQLWTLDLSIKAAKGEDIEEYSDVEKEIEILKREKLTKSKIFKTPKVSYELFNHINDEVWNPISKAINKFDDFFAETKNRNYVNSIKVEKRKKISNPLLKFEDREEVIKPFEIFGHDLEEEEITKIEWVREMLSLKSVSKKIDYKIKCQLELNESLYLFRIVESNTNSEVSETLIFESENDYRIYFMSDIIEGIIRKVSNHLIQSIKSNE